MERPNLRELFNGYKDMIVSNAIGTVFVFLIVVIFFIVKAKL